MATRRLPWFLAILALVMTPSFSQATNGDNLIGVGPISRAMGGVGIAAPQDAISAVFSNPASMCFGSFCPSSQVDFAGTLFMPTVRASVTNGPQLFQSTSEHRIYPIPAMGISWNFAELPKWRFGFGAYGISGQGVNYLDTPLDRAFFPMGPPLAAGTFTDLMIMKFAPTIAYQPLPWLSLGIALNVDYSTLNLGSGNAANFGVGAQIGAIAKPLKNLSLGLTYTTPQRIRYRKVLDFDQNGRRDDLVLESPHTVGFGVAYEPFPKKLLLEANIKWLNWSGAAGYGDFDWKDQIVVNFGVQYKPIPKLALRAGYNYGNNPVKEHRGFNGLTPVYLQGQYIPQYYYETFRNIGFPAVTEHHLSVGAGYEITDRFIVNVGYVHGFNSKVTSTGTNILGQPTRLSSSLYTNAVDIGFSVRW